MTALLEQLIKDVTHYAEGIPMLMRNGDDISHEVGRIISASKAALAEYQRQPRACQCAPSTPVDYAAERDPCWPYVRLSNSRET